MEGGVFGLGEEVSESWGRLKPWIGWLVCDCNDGEDENREDED